MEWVSGRVEVERLAEPFGTRFGGPPVDLHAAAQTVGITDICYRPIDSAALLQNGPVEGTYGVIIRSLDGHTRQRFSLAHEIAHVVLGIVGDEWRYKGQVASRGERNPEERMCDYFAGALLMPRPMVLQSIRSNASVEDLARTFEVSVWSMKIRLEHLGLRELEQTG